MKLYTVVSVLATTVVACFQTQAAYLIPVVPVGGSTSTLATGINDSNVIAGFYTGSDGNEHGFDGTLDGTYTTFDVGKTITEPEAINNLGTIVGNSDVGAFYGNESGQYVIIGKGRKDKPLPHETAYGLEANEDEFVGYYLPKGSETWTSYYGENGFWFEDVQLPIQSGSVYAYGIKSGGAIVGSAYIDSDSAYHAFLYQNGSVTFIDDPTTGAYSTVPLAINDNGLVTGSFHIGDKEDGFFYDSTSGTFKTLTVKGTKTVSIHGVNSAGFAAVIASPKTGASVSYIYCPYSKAKCQTFVPAGTHFVEVN